MKSATSRSGSSWPSGALILLLSFLCALSACGSSSSGGSTPPPPPTSTEYLFADADNNVVTYSINSSTGALTQLSYVSGNHGGFGIVANPAATFLYADDLSNGGIDAFSIGASGELTAISGSPFPMPSGWTTGQVDALVVDRGGEFLYAPDAASNTLVGFTIGANGSLGPISGSPFPTGLQPQQVVIDPSDKFVYVSDGQDPTGGISAFTIDSTTGYLTPVSGSPFPTSNLGATGPDGLVIAPSGKFLYVALSNESAVAALSIDSTTGALTAVTGSPYSYNLNNFAIVYSLAISPSGQFLYGLGDSDASIFGFTVDQNTGALTPMSGSPFAVEPLAYIGNLKVDPSGKYLYAGGSSAIVTYSIDSTTGALTSVPPPSGFSQALTIINK